MHQQGSAYRVRRWRWVIWPLALALLVLVVGAACDDDGDDDDAAAAAEATPTAMTPAPRPAYLALGDSLAVGVGASDAASTGYVPLIHEALGGDAAYELVNLGVRGERTDSMIAEGQLDAAVAELVARNGNADPADDVRIVTLDIGGNDVFAIAEVCQDGVDPACLASAGGAARGFADNFGTIVGQIRAAAGPDTQIVVMTYYNSLVDPGCVFNPFAEFGAVVLEGDPSIGIEVGLNDIIRQVAAANGARVVETFEVIGDEQLDPDCLHVNDAGHQAIADAFIAVVEG